MKRVSLDLPDEWLKALKQAALDADFKSSAEFIRFILSNSQAIKEAAVKAGVELPAIERSWGGKRSEQDNHLDASRKILNAPVVEETTYESIED